MEINQKYFSIASSNKTSSEILDVLCDKAILSVGVIVDSKEIIKNHDDHYFCSKWGFLLKWKKEM